MPVNKLSPGCKCCPPVSACACTCLPQVLTFTNPAGPSQVLNPDGTIFYLPGTPFWPFPAFTTTFTWGAPPGGNRWYYPPVVIQLFEGACSVYQTYLPMADPGWYTQPIQTGTQGPGGPNPGQPIYSQFCFYVANCTAFIIAAQTGTFPSSAQLMQPPLNCRACTVNGQPVLYLPGAGAGGSAFTSLNPPPGSPNTCLPFDLKVWSWPASFPVGGGFPPRIGNATGQTIEVYDPSHSMMPLPDCIPLSTNFSAGMPSPAVICPLTHS